MSDGEIASYTPRLRPGTAVTDLTIAPRVGADATLVRDLLGVGPLLTLANGKEYWRMNPPNVPSDAADVRNGLQEDLAGRIKRLVDGQPYGVLCTQGQGQPYGSLVAYAVTQDLANAVFATPRATRKFRLLTECDHVAMVIDNRPEYPNQLMEVEAVTATGRAVAVEEQGDFDRWARLLADRHAYLAKFIRSPSCGLFRIRIVRFFHVTRFQEVRQWVPKTSG